MSKIKIQKYGDGRWGFDDYSSGKRRQVLCSTKEKAQSRADDINVLTANRRGDLLDGTPKEWLEFREWKAAREKSISIAQARQDFCASKGSKSSRHQRLLEQDLKRLEEFIGPAQPIASITVLDIQRFIDSRNVGDRRQFNLRAEIISLFRWAKRMGYVRALDGTTEAEKVNPIEKVAGKPNVLLPGQLRIMLDNVLDVYLPWLAIGAFAGIRTEEIAPDRKSKKSPLRWEDFDWNLGIIVVREETSKVKKERDVPISENLAQWLAPWRNATGPVMGDCPRQPNDRETARLGRLIGGWKHNTLRDSFCSYRTRITKNIHQTSLEMGNSPSMVSRSYHKRQPVEVAQEWFDIRPKVADGKIVGFSQSVTDFNKNQALNGVIEVAK